MTTSTAKLLHCLTIELQTFGRLDAVEAGGPTVEESAQPDFLPWRDNKVVYDEMTGLPLDAKLVHEARTLEVDYMHKMEVYKYVTSEEVKKSGIEPIPTRWVDVDKGDKDTPNIRSRAVCQETRRRSTIAADDIAATFAATPPLEAMRMLCSLAMTDGSGLTVSQKKLPNNHDDRRVLGFYDISRAHFHSQVEREVYIRVPKEDSRCKSGFAKLLKAMYGLRDAGKCFDTFAEKAMKELGFTPGIFSSCVYYHKKGNMACVRHGDDFVVLGTRKQQAKFLVDLQKHMLTKHLGTLGPDPEKGDVGEVRCLNRLIRWMVPKKSCDGKAYHPEGVGLVVLPNAQDDWI